MPRASAYPLGMASTKRRIDDALAAWIAEQPMFFVGTAPLAADGLVNVSPKGPIGTFAVLGPHRVAYLDFFGSGAETVAHLRENARIVVMLCAFSGPPRIVRLHGAGSVVWPGDEGFDALLAEGAFSGLCDVPELRRAIVVVDVERISLSCGYGVPLMEHVGEREDYERSTRKKLRTTDPETVLARLLARNAESLDGLPAVRR